MDHVGLHRGAAGGQLIDDGHVQIPVDNESQGAGNGGGGHDQHVGGMAFGGQGGALGHAEAVLLVGYHEAKIVKFHILRDKGVGPHHQVNVSLGDGLAESLFLCRGKGTGEQSHPNACRFQQVGEGAGMLLSQHLGGSHEGGLHPGLGGQIGPPGGHHRLAGAHVALDQPVHGPAGTEVSGHFSHHPALGLGGREGEQREKFLQRAGWHHPACRISPAVLEHGQTGGQVEELFEGEPPPGQVQTLRGVGKVDVAEGKFRLGQLVLQADRPGERFRHLGSTGLHRRTDEGAEQVVGDACCQGVDRENTAGDRLTVGALKDGVDHGAAAALLLHHAPKDVLLSSLDGSLHIGLVKEGDVQGSRVVHRLYLYQLHTFPDAAEPGMLGGHGLDAHLYPQGSGADGPDLPPVLIVPGKVGHQIPDPGKPKLFQLGAPGRPYAGKVGERGVQGDIQGVRLPSEISSDPHFNISDGVRKAAEKGPPGAVCSRRP